jgi:hypothetical protein
MCQDQVQCLFWSLVQKLLQSQGSFAYDLKSLAGHSIPTLDKDRGIDQATLALQVPDDEAALDGVVGSSKASSG